jgi:hypothetical protein
LFVRGDVSFNSKLAVGDTLTIQQTIRSANIIDLSAANAMIVPRSSTSSAPVAGSMRYHPTLNVFQGYTTDWSSLGGVISLSNSVKIDASNNPGLLFYTGSGNNNPIERMRINNNGDVGIGTTAPTAKLDVNGNVQAWEYTATSDYRIKDYVRLLSDCSFTVDPLKPVTYHNKLSDKQDIGLIAHEVQEHFPFLVTGDKDGEKNQSVNYTGLISLLIHEIQHLKRRVAILEQHTNV